MIFNNIKRFKILSIVFISLLLSSCSGNYQWGWYVILPNNKTGLTNIDFLLSGLGYTISLSLIAIFFAIIIGLVVSVASISENRLLRGLNIGYTEIFRSIPVLVMILWVYYGLPVLINLNFSAFVAGIIALSICESPLLLKYLDQEFKLYPKVKKKQAARWD